MASDDEPPRRGLLVDYGGVLTTNVFASFEAFCRNEGLDPHLVATHFRSNPEARQLLFDLEVGTLTEEEFEPRFAAVIGVTEPASLIDRLFGGMRTDHAMMNAVRAAKDAGVRTGLISNSWGKGRYDRSQFPALFDGVVISGRDVTELKRLEEQLIQAEKLAAMGQMLAGVAHELNNPLTAILGVTELLRDNEGVPENTKRQLELTHRQARRVGLARRQSDQETDGRPAAAGERGKHRGEAGEAGQAAWAYALPDSFGFGERLWQAYGCGSVSSAVARRQGRHQHEGDAEGW